MRITLEEWDKLDRPELKVLLNGKEVDRVIEACETGYVIVNKVDDRGYLIVDGQCVLTERLTGDVKIECSQEVRDILSSPTIVIIESPYAGDVEANIDYARACVRDSLLRGEAPIASHLLYTQPGILDDDIPSERQQGIDAGLAWRRVAHASIVYTDRGITRGMEYGIKAATDAGLPVIYRTLNK